MIYFGPLEASGLARLSRLLQPNAIAVFGGMWAENVIAQCQIMGFKGKIWPVHPRHNNIAGVNCYASVDDLPGVPDAAFLGINREAVIDVTRALALKGCGGAVCFASGFAEAGYYDLQNDLIQAAGDMPLLGPNCYGFINYLDGALLWPDQHGGTRCNRGVAIVSQSSNIAINIGMQARGLPIGYVACVGNQAQTSLTEITGELLNDERINAAGLYIEGIDHPAKFAIMAQQARHHGKYIVAIKSGKTQASQQAAGAHTAALAGNSAASSAFLKQCGVIEVNTLEDLIETLKLLHLFGPLGGNRISAMCCSGGEAGLLADNSASLNLQWPDIPSPKKTALAEQLGPLVYLANPLDYHTFIWGDIPAMTDCFASMMGDWVDLSCLVIDFPRTDRCSLEAWMPAVTALKQAAARTGTKAALIASLGENMPDSIATNLTSDGVAPLCGFQTGLSAIARIAALEYFGKQPAAWIPYPGVVQNYATMVLDEAASKKVLQKVGVEVPAGITVHNPATLIDHIISVGLSAPFALKGLGALHKSEKGLVALGLELEALPKRAAEMRDAQGYLVEEMVAPAIVELLVGLQRDPQYGICLTIGCGGILAELLHDIQNLLLPVDKTKIKDALDRLQFAPLLHGFRGQNVADIDAAVDHIFVLCRLITRDTTIAAIEINPLMLGKLGEGAIAADALIWRYAKA